MEVITADDAFVHVSGHPAQDRLIQMYQWVRPQLAVPIHGEVATKPNMPAWVLSGRRHHHPENGSIIRLAGCEVVGQVQHGRLALDGKRIVPLDAGVMRGRHRMMYNGAAVATLVMDAAGALVTQPQVTVMGLIEDPKRVRSWSKSVSPCGKPLRSCRCKPGLTTRRCSRLPGSLYAAASMRARAKSRSLKSIWFGYRCVLTGDVDREQQDKGEP